MTASTLSFSDARDLATEFGAKRPRFDHTSPLAQSWIDRIANLLRWEGKPEKWLAGAIAEANRYAF